MNAEEEAKRYVDKFGKKIALEKVQLAIDSMIRSCPIKRHTKQVKKYIETYIEPNQAGM
jgi:hypothetical protein